MHWLVTTGYDPTDSAEEMARNLAHTLSLPYVARERNSLNTLRSMYTADRILIITKNRIQVTLPSGDYFFHIGMAKLRIKNIREGKYDHMALAMDVKAGDSILDCTLGMGTDAIVASYITGASGSVRGVEASDIIAEIVARGLQNYDPEDDLIKKAMERITVTAADALTYLREQAEKSVDIVYFDPMFRRTVEDSNGISLLRELGNQAPLSVETVQAAMRVARKRVVLKEAARSQEFVRLGFENISGGKYSSVNYGYIVTGVGE